MSDRVDKDNNDEYMNERVMSIENALKTIAKYSLKYKCKDGVTIDFAQCHSWNGEIVKFLRSYFDADYKYTAL